MMDPVKKAHMEVLMQEYEEELLKKYQESNSTNNDEKNYKIFRQIVKSIIENNDELL